MPFFLQPPIFSSSRDCIFWRFRHVVSVEMRGACPATPCGLTEPEYWRLESGEYCKSASSCSVHGWWCYVLCLPCSNNGPLENPRSRDSWLQTAGNIRIIAEDNVNKTGTCRSRASIRARFEKQLKQEKWRGEPSLSWCQWPVLAFPAYY